jgi:cytoskeletal protein RodZ
MKSFLTPLACGTFLVALAAFPAFAAAQQQSQTSQQSQPPAQTGQQTQTTSPAQTSSTTTPPSSTTPSSSTAQSGSTTPQKQAPVNSSVPPPPPPPDQTAPAAAQTGAQKTAQPGSDAPLPQQDTPNVKAGSKQDVNAIGDRNVGKGGVDFYSIEHEIALGKSLAQEVEKTSKLVDDPVIVEYVNRVGQNLVRNSDAKVPFTIKVIDSDEINAFALPGGFF